MSSTKRPKSGMAIFADDDVTSRPAPVWFIVPFAIALAWVGVTYYRQKLLHVPVPSRPAPGAVVDARSQVGFTWTLIPNKDVSYHIQVATDRKFRRIVFETKVKNIPQIKHPGMVKPGSRYYWRLRTIVDGKRSPWTGTIKFTTE